MSRPYSKQYEEHNAKLSVPSGYSTESGTIPAQEYSGIKEYEDRISALEKELHQARAEWTEERKRCSRLEGLHKQLREAAAAMNIDYWLGIEECQCSSVLPTGGCLHCDLLQFKQAVMRQNESSEKDGEQ